MSLNKYRVVVQHDRKDERAKTFFIMHDIEEITESVYKFMVDRKHENPIIVRAEYYDIHDGIIDVGWKICTLVYLRIAAYERSN